MGPILNLLIAIPWIQRPLRLPTKSSKSGLRSAWLTQDLADVIVMLSMRPAEVSSLQIINYKPDSKDPPAWYKAGYSWYCTGCRKQRDKLMPMRLLSMEKDLEHARELLTWIQDAIKAEKLRDPVYTETGKRNNVPFAKFIKSLKTNQDKDEITSKLLRKTGAKHASMVYASPNPTPQHLDNLSEITLRHKINHLDAGKNYALAEGTQGSYSDMFIRDTINWVDQSSPPSSPVLEPKKDIPPPVQQDQSVKVYSDAIKQYASETGLDLQSEELKKAFFAGLSVDNKK
ncbi:22570_t:CDS:2 [Rhizophagus irregularis]|nr:22570_t:CDS:2 [Rhizophagus irregularis]